MNRIPRTLTTALAGLAFLAAPAAAQAQDDWDFDWGWYDDPYGYEYGADEYGYGLNGFYDNETYEDDWYYDSYGYNEGENEDANEITYDEDLFGDDEWEPENEGVFQDTALFEDNGAYEGYGYDQYDYNEEYGADDNNAEFEDNTSDVGIYDEEGAVD